ncbi:MAG: antibiotic biosynthesis monooxygenase [Spirochaetae bacterium HGW-Spirochaetae-1]|jgi:quinol monooxygenase YgiN|nr:MAG: antibiotic biosynthesis monooxygenase [Spirochaetae bacterium HGW-Spirochaetae-1]
MLIVQVHVKVRPDSIGAFIEATRENAKNSLLEKGIARFDVIQQADDPSSFILIEAYRDDDAPARHKETSHYNIWRDAVDGMMAEPRTGIKYINIFPDDKKW